MTDRITVRYEAFPDSLGYGYIGFGPHQPGASARMEPVDEYDGEDRKVHPSLVGAVIDFRFDGSIYGIEVTEAPSVFPIEADEGLGDDGELSLSGVIIPTAEGGYVLSLGLEPNFITEWHPVDALGDEWLGFDMGPTGRIVGIRVRDQQSRRLLPSSSA
ncbi:MAG: hypothetical protein JWM90_2157 [Thermoleophilia bacterium]|nr:hypothetical protein [Thermoleophilia bacterium]